MILAAGQECRFEAVSTVPMVNDRLERAQRSQFRDINRLRIKGSVKLNKKRRERGPVVSEQARIADAASQDVTGPPNRREIAASHRECKRTSPPARAPQNAVLHASSGALVLREVDGSWWQLSVEIGPTPHVLGSDTKKVIVSRLREGLAGSLGSKTAGVFDGTQTAWVLSLSEEHCSVYAGDEKGSRRFFFQDADGAHLGSLSLSSEEREAWLTRLEELQG